MEDFNLLGLGKPEGVMKKRWNKKKIFFYISTLLIIIKFYYFLIIKLKKNFINLIINFFLYQWKIYFFLNLNSKIVKFINFLNIYKIYQ